MRRNIRGYAVAILALSLACGSKNNGGNNTPNNVTITGQLQAGSVTHHMTETSTDGVTTRTDALTGALAGYILYCVTFASPPVAGSATADGSGNVTVTLAAQGVAFGCFVQDPGGNTVATLSFQGASTAGTSLQVSGNTNLGNITVDTSTGLASANVSTGTVAATPPGSTCPLGTWIFQTGASESVCVSTAPQTTARIWVAPAASGSGFTVSLIHGPESHGQSSCTYGSWGGMAGTYANGKLSFGPFNGNSGGSCPNMISIQMTPNANCTTATAAVHFEGCGSCGSGSDVCSGGGGTTCGTAVCNATYNGARQ